MMLLMNSITHTFNGLASSLLLNVGLTQAAQKLDPISKSGSHSATSVQTAAATYPCAFAAATYPCAFSAKQGS
jgi:hypothetical protein